MTRADDYGLMTMRRTKTTLPVWLGLTCCWLLAPAAPAQLQSLDAEQMQIIYPGEAFAYLLPHIAACSENALRFHQELYS